MLSQPDLIQVRNYVIRILPEILRQEPEIGTAIEGILAQQFPKRDEFARLLDEVALLREDSNQRFDELREDTNRRFDELREDTNRRSDKLREDTNRRSDELREDMNRRFEQVDQRFEQMHRRFEQVDQRFEQVDQRFEQMHRTQLELKRNMLQLQEGQKTLLNRIDGQSKWQKLNLGMLGSDKGERLENMFAEALRYGLNNPDIIADQIQLRQPLFDPDGQVFRPNYATEIDLITENHRRTVFEVKASAKVDDVYLFALKVELVALQNPEKPVHGVFICLGASEEVQQHGAEYGLEMIV
jgi:hypothetical protein